MCIFSRTDDLRASLTGFAKSHAQAFCKAADAQNAGVVNPSLDSHLCSSGAQRNWRCKLTAGIRRQACSVATLRALYSSAR